MSPLRSSPPGDELVSDSCGASCAHPLRSTLPHVETDAELLSLLQRGDEQAFVMLVNRYQMPLLRLACSMVSDRSVAEEAVQDTWMGVVRGIDRFGGRSSLKTWLFHILVNRVRSARTIEQQRRLQRTPSVDPECFTPSGQWSEPVESWDDELAERLDAMASCRCWAERSKGFRRANVRSCCSAMWRACRARKPVTSSVFGQGIKGFCCTAVGPTYARRLRLK
jgi:RNA polymerase sigma factor (sigma-70 family)